jgi:multiple sugar transport system substrate-binding protein
MPGSYAMPALAAGGSTSMRIAAIAGLLATVIGAAPPQRVTIHFLMWKPQQREVWGRLFAEFEAANPGLQVSAEEAPAAANEFHATLATKLRAQDPTLDAFLIDMVWPAELAGAGYLEPLGDLLDPDRYVPEAVRAATVQGRAVSIPFNVDCGVLYYRRDLLTELGLTPPETWDELARQAEAIRVRHPEVVGYTGQFDRYEGLVCNMLEFVASNGGRFERDGQVVLDTRAQVAVAWVRDRLIGPVAPRDVLNQREPESREVFLQGHAAFHRNWPETWRIANDPGRSRVAGTVGLAPLPRFEGGRSASALGGWQLAVASSSARKSGARRLVRFLSSPLAQKRLSLQTGHIPARMEVLDDPEVLAAFPHFALLKGILRTAQARPQLADYAAFSDRLQRKLYAAIAGSGGDIGPLPGALAMGLLLGLAVLLARGRRRTG